MTTPTPAERAPNTLSSPPLDSRRAELERLGFKIIPSSNGVIGARGKFYWDCGFTKLNVVVFVRQVELLDEATFESLKDEINEISKGVSTTVLPRGFQSGQAVVGVFIADQFDEALKHRLASSRSRGSFAKTFFPILIDAKSESASYYQKTPLVGGVYYGKFRWLAERLAKPGASDEKEPVSLMGAAVSFAMIAILAGLLAPFF